MIAFIEKLNSEVLRSIERIESRDTDVLKKSLEASRVLGEAFDRLKQYIIGYRFQNDDEEIKFFKEIKPRLFCRLIYYRKLYNIEMNRPVGSIEAQREYLDAHVRAINAYTQKRLDFIRYFRSGAHTWTASISCAGRPTRSNTWKPSTMNSTRSFDKRGFQGGENPGQRYVVGLSYGRIGITGEHEPPEHGSAIV